MASTSDLVERTKELFQWLEKADKFSVKYQAYPYPEAERVLQKLYDIASTIGELESPSGREELLRVELRRRILGKATLLEKNFKGEYFDFDTVISIYAIPRSDLEELRPWLEEQKDLAVQATERIFKSSPVENYELQLKMDIPVVERQAAEFAAVQIQRYHRAIGKLLQKLTKVGIYLRDVNAVPTRQERSYFDPLTLTLALSISDICYNSEDGTLHSRERRLLELYGHEGMGHALHKVLSANAEIPHFLQDGSDCSTIATTEAVAQFYEKRIFDDLRTSSETQRALNIAHRFEDIYQEAQDMALLNDYKLRLNQYALLVLADKELGDPGDKDVMARKIELLKQVSIFPQFPSSFVEKYRHQFDSKGNLSSSLIGELRYCAKPVQRALDEFGRQSFMYDEKSRDLIDKTFLTGFWTPIGFVENARLVAQGK